MPRGALHTARRSTTVPVAGSMVTTAPPRRSATCTSRLPSSTLRPGSSPGCNITVCLTAAVCRSTMLIRSRAGSATIADLPSAEMVSVPPLIGGGGEADWTAVRSSTGMTRCEPLAGWSGFGSNELQPLSATTIATPPTSPLCPTLMLRMISPHSPSQGPTTSFEDSRRLCPVPYTRGVPMVWPVKRTLVLVVALAALLVEKGAQAQQAVPAGWLEAQLNERGQHCDNRAAEQSQGKLLVACGAAGVWELALGGPGPRFVRSYEFPGDVVGFFSEADGRLWVKLQLLEARP